MTANTSASAIQPTAAALNPSRSPSPTTPPPIAESPGPRATALQRVFADALSHTLKACSYANFAACFPTPARQVPDSLQDLWRNFTAQLEERCKTNFDALLADRNVITSLNELDRLVAEAKRRRERAISQQGQGGGPVEPPIPPHTLPPSQLYIAHLTPFLRAQSGTLTARAETLGRENAELAARVQEQRAEIEALVGGLEAVVADLETAARMVADGGEEEEVRGLSKEVMDLDKEMRG